VSANLTQVQVADVLGLTPRRLQQMDVDGLGPPRDERNQYPSAAFGDWMRKRDTASARDRLLEAQADIAEMEAAEKAGELVRRAATTQAWGEQTAAFRARLVNLPQAVAPLVAPHDKVAEVQAEIERHVHQALQELSGAS
jgi:phage terminase Nu1 subunit (DNA packaging protein)